jgi:hypothetical protein
MDVVANYILLDAARMKQQIHRAKAIIPNYVSLYKGRNMEDLADVGPYLFVLETEKKFASWYKETGWGNSWGVQVNSTADRETLFHHFQKFVLVENEEGKQLYFRFYDPRVLRIFLPSCDNLQLEDFFGPVQQFICEDENPDFALVFSYNGRKLIKDKVKAETIFSAAARAEQLPAISSSAGTGNTNQQEVKPPDVKPKRKFIY